MQLQEKEQLLTNVITKIQTNIENSKLDLLKHYEEEVNTLLENKQIIEQFKKQTKEYENIQFYIKEVTPPDLFSITAKYMGTGIMTITISKDKTIATTEEYTKSNKEIFNCDIQLKDEEFNSINTAKFLNYFNGEIKVKGKLDSKSHIESMLLAEFSKTSSYDKLLTGIQPIKYVNLYYPIPITLKSKEIDHINILARTKVRKITIVEVTEDTQDLDTILANATTKAIQLLDMLHSIAGEKYYKLFGFHGRLPQYITIKVCIAVPKSSKIKSFEPYQIRYNVSDVIDFRYMQYENTPQEITSIKTNVNDSITST